MFVARWSQVMWRKFAETRRYHWPEPPIAIESASSTKGIGRAWISIGCMRSQDEIYHGAARNTATLTATSASVPYRTDVIDSPSHQGAVVSRAAIVTRLPVSPSGEEQILRHPVRDQAWCQCSARCREGRVPPRAARQPVPKVAGCVFHPAAGQARGARGGPAQPSKVAGSDDLVRISVEDQFVAEVVDGPALGSVPILPDGGLGKHAEGGAQPSVDGQHRQRNLLAAAARELSQPLHPEE